MHSELLSRLIAGKPSAARRTGSGSPTADGADAWGGLMVAAQNGHGGAYRRLLTEMSEWLIRYFGRRLPATEVDDAVQETLMAVHRRRHTYDPAFPLQPWLSAIAKRKWVDQLRSLGSRPMEEVPESASIGDHESAVVSSSVLASLLEQLRPAQARVILLMKVHGYSVEEASRETGLSPSAVKMNVHRGLLQLSSFIEKNDHVE